MREAQIVLIEDNPGDILLVELALQENGIRYELTKFATGKEAARALCGPTGPGDSDFQPDAILLDLNTPRSDGFQVLLQLKHSPRLARVPIAVITSSSANSDRQRVLLEGVRFIQKPSNVDAFFRTIGQAVREMLNGKG